MSALLDPPGGLVGELVGTLVGAIVGLALGAGVTGAPPLLQPYCAL